jgi:type IV secretory pathway TrbF-like protein
MAKGQFFPWLKPDRKQKLVKPQISVASYVVDQWRRMAIAGVAIGFVGMAGGLVAGAWAFQKERMPSYTITPIIQPNGWMVETYTDDSDKPLNERIACSVLQTTIYMLRTVAGSPSGTKSNLEIATNNFADHAAIRARRELDAQDWYAPLFQQRRTREVLPDMQCYRLAHSESAYNIEWTERIHSQLGKVETATKRTLSVVAARMDKTPDKLASWNPWGLFITEYSGVLD